MVGSTQEQTEVVEVFPDAIAVLVAEHLVEGSVDRIGRVQRDGSFIDIQLQKVYIPSNAPTHTFTTL